MLECQLDDMTGEHLGHVLEQLVAKKGVLDVYYTPVHMKKNRPGVLLSTLVTADSVTEIEDYLLLFTSTFGIRKREVNRTILDRKIITYLSPFGKIDIKVGFKQGKIIKAVPEYECVKKQALETNIPFHQVYSTVQTYCLDIIAGKVSIDHVNTK
ncbi:DUF111 family protein [Vagococcus lutrae]|uniref:nickel insertion protein n=1 Tax=Vagococcus lutrae TaxID=81947 RepID=UPI00288F6D40|nr:nickel insertion protein [Vagococcus lutrae]MDT2811935.1 DUF111 family protein [Vagococcus lutrae]